LLSSDEGDLVFDPFAGSGVVVAEAERLGRLGLGTELVKRHVDEFSRIIRPEILNRGSDSNGSGNGSAANADLIIKLRMLKLPVVLMRRAARRREEISWPLGVVVLPRRERRTNGSHATTKMAFIVRNATAAQRKRYAEALREAAGRAPASKFGVDTEIEVVTPPLLASLVAGRKIFAYRNGKTSRASEPIPHKELEAFLVSAEDDATPPVLSSVFVDVAPRPEVDLTTGRPERPSPS
jgi:hypothetical protein